MREITDLMNSYRECSRNLWNVYFSRMDDVGGSLDAFGNIRRLLFEALVVGGLPYEGNRDGGAEFLPNLKVVPKESSAILIKRLTLSGEAGYWDQERDMAVGPDDLTLAFVDFFDFAEVPIKEFRYYRCKIVTFSAHAEYEGREALVEVLDSKVFHG